MIGTGLYPCVLGSRILGGHPVRNGMPWWKYVANRALTFFSNVLMHAKLPGGFVDRFPAERDVRVRVLGYGDPFRLARMGLVRSALFPRR